MEAFLSALGVAVVTALLTVRLSIRQFRSERWWERKADAYSAIIEALSHELSAKVDLIRAEEEQVARATDDTSRERLMEARRRISLATATGAFIISDEAAGHLKVFRREILNVDARSYYDQLCAEHDAIEECIKALNECARMDLRLDGWVAKLMRKVRRGG